MTDYTYVNTINIANTTYFDKNIISVNLAEVPWVGNDMSNSFANCRNLTNVTNIHNTVTNMHSSFVNCVSLTAIPELPDSITNLDYGFQNCTKLESASIIPDSITTMVSTFENCTNLTGDIKIYSTNISNASECFAGTSVNKTVYIPYRFENHIYTPTYNAFTAVNYSSETRQHGVLLKNLGLVPPRFTINPIPVDALVVLSADGYTQQGNSISVDEGTTITWSVSKPGFTTQNGTFVMGEDDKIITVNLEYTGANVITQDPTTVYLEPGTYKYICVGAGGGGSKGSAARVATRSSDGGDGGAGGGSGYIKVGMFNTPGENVTFAIGSGGADKADGLASSITGSVSGLFVTSAGGKYGRCDTIPIMPRGGDGGSGGGAGGTSGRNQSGTEIAASNGGRGGLQGGNGERATNLITSTYDGGIGYYNTIKTYAQNAGIVNDSQNPGNPGQGGIGLSSYSDHLLSLSDFYAITEAECYNHIAGGGGGSGGLTPPVSSTPDWQGGPGAGGGGWFDGESGATPKALKDTTLYVIFYNTNTGSGWQPILDGTDSIRISESNTLGRYERIVYTLNIHENNVLVNNHVYNYKIDYYDDDSFVLDAILTMTFSGNDILFHTEYTSYEKHQADYTITNLVSGDIPFAGGKGGDGAILYHKMLDPTLIIIPTPTNATVSLTAPGYTQLGNGIMVPYNTAVTYSVSAAGYVTQTNTVTVTEDKVMNIALEEAYYTFTINPTPSDATVILDASGFEQEGNSIRVKAGVIVNWSVSRESYASKTGTYTVNNDYTLPVILSSRPTLTINALPADATVTLTADGYTQAGNSITVESGVTVNWSVTKAGYITQSGSYTMQNEDVTWTKELFVTGVVLVTSNTTTRLPAGTYRYICVGGGGGGGRAGYSAYQRGLNTYAAGGGGSGYITAGTFTTTGEDFTFTIGTGGSTGSTTTSVASAGTASSISGAIIGTVTTANGGAGGYGTNSGNGGAGYSGGGAGGHSASSSYPSSGEGGAGGSNGSNGVNSSNGGIGGTGKSNTTTYNANNGAAASNPDGGTPSYGLGLINVTGISSNTSVFDTYSQNIQNNNYAACAYPQGGGGGGGSNGSRYTRGSGGAGGGGYYNGTNPTCADPSISTSTNLGGNGGNGAILYRQI